MSYWNTPVATPSAPIAPEPVSVVLQKHNLDVNERVRQIAASLLPQGPKARLFTDTSSVVEQLPNLLLLLKEASNPSIYLTDETASNLFELFSLKSLRSISRLVLQHSSTTFVFPLSSLPASIDWTSSDFAFYRHLSFISQRKNLVDLHAKTIHLDAIDYYFFVLGALSIVSDGRSTGRWAGSGSGAWSSSTGWYDASLNGSIYDRLLLEIIEVSDNGSGIPAVLAHKSELTLAVFSDFLLDLNLYTFNNTNVEFDRVFELLTKMVHSLIHKSLMTSSSSTFPGVFSARVVKLMTDLADTNNLYSQKFMHRVSGKLFHSFASCFRVLCLPWEEVNDMQIGTSTKDSWIKKNKSIYLSFQSIVTSPPVVEFARNYKLHSDNRLADFVAQNESRLLVEAIVVVLSIASPSTGIVEAVPAAFSPAAIRALWSICRACTWINGKVPRNMSDASWRMDEMVNASKVADSKHEIYSIFSWDVTQPESMEPLADTVPKRLTDIAPTRGVRKSVSGQLHVSWDQPACASEVVVVVSFLRLFISRVFDVDLKEKPTYMAWMRWLGSTSALTVIAFFLWLVTSIAICPSLSSGMTIGLIQLVFVLLVGSLALKWMSSQYIV
jgi:hypothetical protein